MNGKAGVQYKSLFQICIKDIQSMNKNDIPLVREMKELGVGVLRDQGGDVDKVMTGFHWPIHTVSHLHMHIISPSDGLRFMKKLEFSSMFFGDTESAIEMLEKK